MGTLTAKYIIDKAVIQLNDLSAARWSRAELLQWLNDAQRTIVMISPNSSNKVSVVSLVAGTQQSIPSDGWTLLDAYRNMGADGATPGRVLRFISKELLDGFNPDWHSGTKQKVVKNIIFDPQNQTKFWVYPPSDGTGTIEVNYAQVPPALSAETDVIGLNDILQAVILDYMLYRACSKDAEYAAGMQLATGYWQSFTNGLGLKAEAEVQNSPNQSLQPTKSPSTPGAES